MDTISIEFGLVPQLYEQLVAVAQARNLSTAELARRAVAEWLERQTPIECARRTMRELGQGLGKGNQVYDVARDHDAHLYLQE